MVPRRSGMRRLERQSETTQTPGQSANVSDAPLQSDSSVGDGAPSNDALGVNVGDQILNVPEYHHVDPHQRGPAAAPHAVDAR